MQALFYIAMLSGFFAFVNLAMAMMDISFGTTQGVMSKLVVFLAASANTIAIFIAMHSVSP